LVEQEREGESEKRRQSYIIAGEGEMERRGRRDGTTREGEDNVAGANTNVKD
jgi:hypothetical protein